MFHWTRIVGADIFHLINNPGLCIQDWNFESLTYYIPPLGDPENERDKVRKKERNTQDFSDCNNWILDLWSKIIERSRIKIFINVQFRDWTQSGSRVPCSKQIIPNQQERCNGSRYLAATAAFYRFHQS